MPFGLPFRPTPFTATFTLSVNDTPFTITLPIQARSEGDIFSGEKRSEIHVVPAFAVTTTPEIVVVVDRLGSREPGAGNRKGRARHRHQSCEGRGEGRCRAASCRKAGARRRRRRPVSFTREDEQMTVRFALQPPSAATLAAAAMKPGGNQFVGEGVASLPAAQTYAQGYQVVEYPHTTRRHVLVDPQVAVKALDVSVKPNLTRRLRDGRGR